jgi:hypothetical protein
MPAFLAPLLAGAARAVAGPAIMRVAGPALARGAGTIGGSNGLSALQFGAVALANSDQTHLNQDKEQRNG